jgi:hypothetical protein
MADHTARIGEAVSARLRRLDGLLHIDRGGRSEWDWAIPIAGFLVTVAILVVAGVMSGVWAAEYIPTALVVGLVMAGLFVACMAPEAVPPEDDRGDGGGDGEPSQSPPPLDPRVWRAVLDGLDVDPAPTSVDGDGEALREPVGATR